jgi:epoxyqueuosine reductase QueG
MPVPTALSEVLYSAGASLVSFADLQPLEASIRHHLPRGVSIAVAMDPLTIAGIADGPTREYYDDYRRANGLLDHLAQIGEEFLTRQGIRAKGFPAIRGTGIDPQTNTTLLPHKTIATRAGMGWIGKCALLVTESYGSAIRLTSILTDAPLPCGTPVDESRCGVCALCVEACPGHAPQGRMWHAGVGREEILDASACRQAARASAKSRTGIEETFCGICIAVCPWTNRYIQRAAGGEDVNLDTNI